MHPLEARIGYKFRNSLLLAEALTHSSLWHETQQLHFDNQRLEYLGDAVLQLIVGEALFRRFPNADEGHLSKGRARLVSGEALAVYARGIQLGDHLMLGRSDESNGGRHRTSTLADAFEALVGAMYLDGGMDIARSFFLEQARHELASANRQPLVLANSKGRLQEILQAIPPPPGLGATSVRNPTYRIVAESGPDHAKAFTAEVVWAGCTLGRGDGSNKQQAEFAAASDALRGKLWVTDFPAATDSEPG